MYRQVDIDRASEYENSSRVSQTITDLIAIRALVLLKIMHGGLQTHHVTIAQVAQVTTNSVGGHLAAVKVT